MPTREVIVDIGKESKRQDTLRMSLNTVLWFGQQVKVERKDGRWYVVEGEARISFKEYQEIFIHGLNVKEVVRSEGKQV